MTKKVNSMKVSVALRLKSNVACLPASFLQQSVTVAQLQSCLPITWKCSLFLAAETAKTSLLLEAKFGSIDTTASLVRHIQTWPFNAIQLQISSLQDILMAGQIKSLRQALSMPTLISTHLAFLLIRPSK